MTCCREGEAWLGGGVCLFLGCPDARRLPNLLIRLNGRVYPLTPEQYILPRGPWDAPCAPSSNTDPRLLFEDPLHSEE